jgi:hypothetical protein
MANTINVAIISTANTFNQWRINDNLMANDVNEIVRGNFVKPKGNVTITEGFLRLANTTGGVVLDVADDTNIDGTLTVFNVELDNSTNHLYVDAGDIHYRRMGATDLYKINTNTVIYATNVSISNATVGGTFNVSSNTLITASNVTISNTQVGGTFNVASNTTISSQKVRVSNTTADARFNVSPNTYFFGNHVNIANTHSAATFEVTPNTFIFASANVSANVNVGARLEVTGNANLYSNLAVTWNTFTGNATVTQNTVTGNLAVTQNTTSGNLVVSNRTQTNNLTVVNLANISNANLINATITTLTVIDPIQAPATTADDKYILRFGATTDGNGTFRVQRSAVSGNAELFWNDITDSWNFLANGLPTTLNTGNLNVATLNVTTANIGTVLTRGGINVSQQAADAYTQANAAANLVAVYANGGLIMANANINFVNSATLNVSVTANGTLKAANVAFTLNTSAGVLGPQGPQGPQGVAGAQGPQGPQGPGGGTGAQGPQGPQGPGGGTGATGPQGPQGPGGGTGATGPQGPQGPGGGNGATGPQGPQGPGGGNGATGPQGPQGPGGGNGATGPQGPQGPSGPGGAGSLGPQGPQGPQGPGGGTGATGPQGPQGPGGGNGATGPQGPQGPAGAANTTDHVYFGGLIVSTSSTAVSSNEIRSSGDIVAYYSSDRRLKENIRVIENALEIIRQIDGVRYDWTNESMENRGGEDGYFVRKEDVGVIAQDLLKVLPEVVAERPDGTLAVKYEKIVALLLAAIKELDKKHDDLVNHLRKV